MALGIALVMIVNSLSTGVRTAQSEALSSVYGFGTDITITAAPQAPANGERPSGSRFEFGSREGSATGHRTTEVAKSRLTTGRGSTSFKSTALKTVQGSTGVAAASGVLSLNNVTFNDEIPSRSEGSTMGSPSGNAQRQGPGGGGAFNVDSFTVMGVDAEGATVGPLASATLSSGRLLGADDAGKYNVVLDAAYATSSDLALKDKLSIGGTNFTGTGAEAETASNSYTPLDVAQKLSDKAGMASTLYVLADNADKVSALKADLANVLPDNTINTQADLGSTVTGSLSTASGLVASLGTWLSVAVLGVAFLLAILLTLSGVSRRTREFGTLKAIGWRNTSIVKQVAGESLIQSLIGGVIGIVAGVAGILIVNLFSPTLTAAAASSTQGSGFMGGGAGSGGERGGGAAAQAVATAADVVLHLPFSVNLMALAVAVAGGLLARILGGWRAARLRPAEALRSVA
ncbi:ABC transporter permease [Paeniglutamicibacter cryotolerans]|uniref:ABC-type antimicrobial peptide transport system permease subunit n=2 Tax=Paeniglutamicibacter cryotolerans TaxID=670079 RepID=A0A839QKB7_9MICC|nr:ABC-type antimicrobial peptide transport system permease subunit [Paeniglutamicibacter cryotolerans]